MKELLMEVREKLARHDEILANQSRVLDRIDRNVSDMDGRLRNVEVKAATSGGITGGVVAIGIAYITGKLKGL